MGEQLRHSEHADVRAWLSHAYPDIRRFAAVVGPSEMAPDDLVHDAIVRVMQAGGFDRLSNPMAYIKRTIVNLASNERRRLGSQRRALRRVRQQSESSYGDAYPSDLDPLLALSPEARAVVYLHYVNGESFEAIAADLQLHAGSVRQTATRARRRLAELEGDNQ